MADGGWPCEKKCRFCDGIIAERFAAYLNAQEYGQNKGMIVDYDWMPR